MALNRDKIRELRIKRGWSFSDASSAAGFGNRNMWYMVESGRRVDPSLSTVEKIASALGVGVEKLLTKSPGK
jgi:transcriptional regulator with XRE-family HTH domain